MPTDTGDVLDAVAEGLAPPIFNLSTYAVSVETLDDSTRPGSLADRLAQARQTAGVAPRRQT